MPNGSNMFHVKKSHDTNESDKQLLEIISIDVNTSEITINHYPLIPPIACYAGAMDSNLKTLSAAAKEYNNSWASKLDDDGKPKKPDPFKITLSKTEVEALANVFDKLSNHAMVPNNVKSKFVEAKGIVEAHSLSKTPRP